MKTTLDSVKAVAGHVIGRGIGMMLIPVASLMELTVECEYFWKHPYSDEGIRKTRLDFERKLAMAKFDGERYVEIQEYRRRELWDYLMHIETRMFAHDCTVEELKAICTIIGRVWPMWYDKRKGIDKISINNLKWIFKMEDKYAEE